MTGKETCEDTEQTSVESFACQADALPIELQPHPDSVNGRKSVAPSLAKLDSYNNHRPIQRVSAAVLNQSRAPAAARFSLETPAREVTHPKLSERAGAVSSSSRYASVGKGGASEVLGPARRESAKTGGRPIRGLGPGGLPQEGEVKHERSTTAPSTGRGHEAEEF